MNSVLGQAWLHRLGGVQMIFRASLLAIILTGAAFAGPVTLADTTADFSGVQGQLGWTYGYLTDPFTPSTFSNAGLEFNISQPNRWTLSPFGENSYLNIGSDLQAPDRRLFCGVCC